jgi:deoxyxylulose-5-phosphate synthase
MGMAEQLLMLAAAGMAHEGFVPFATTYAVFASRRAYDFISQGIAEEGLNVKICCALPGLTTGYGPSHQATEDVAIFRGMPDLTIVMWTAPGRKACLAFSRERHWRVEESAVRSRSPAVIEAALIVLIMRRSGTVDAERWSGSAAAAWTGCACG